MDQTKRLPIVTARRKLVEETLEQSRREVEQRVQERTAELKAVNRRLEAEVTERKRAEETLRESEERLVLAQRAGRVGVFDADLINDRVVWTEQLEKLFGLAHGSFEGTYGGWTRWMAAAASFSYLPNGTPARMGGDEFNILLSGVTSGESIINTARKILGSFRRHCLINGHEIDVAISIGISIYPDDARDRESLFRNADAAMYHAKELGGRTYRFYSPSMNTLILKQARIESRLRQSLDRGELEIRYQPQVDSGTRRVVCAEALVRWRHPEQGLLRPGDFILLAEKTGYITAGT